MVKEPDERARLAICYLNGPANPLFVVCLKRVLQVGLAAVDICAGIYPDELSGLGLIEEIRDSAWQVTVCDPWPVATAPVIGA